MLCGYKVNTLLHGKCNIDIFISHYIVVVSGSSDIFHIF